MGGGVRSLAMSADNQVLVSGRSTAILQVWDLQSATLKYTLKGHQGRILTLAIHPTEPILASGGTDRTVKLWNLETGKLLHTLPGGADWVNTLVLSPRSPVVIAGTGKQIKIWDRQTGQLLKMIPQPKDITDLALSLDGELLVGSYKAQAGQSIVTFNGIPYSASKDDRL
jgi:WD40 repeat protein